MYESTYKKNNLLLLNKKEKTKLSKTDVSRN